ncbi:hypothetical protein D9613_001811 [Agrocybe pediades]|uniref:TECPR1-like DysF domain-containing protein n=1 Tax=Agrocybe pediades TaxID=84607 RepID=A0A8H4R6U0_9AGAR|nr:hypothetical protein D9613_001811 [Agrocybe pediades]KAF9568383.1 hypothetical protein CPC08DRAFT_679254 [Agrocybe pediades]
MDTTLVASPAHFTDFHNLPSVPSSVDDTLPPNPSLLVPDDDPTVIDSANKKLRKKSRLSRIFSRSNAPNKSPLTENQSPSSSRSDLSLSSSREVQASGLDDSPINLDNSALCGEDVHIDRYEWAVVYENQRGLTFFSIPYYSNLSLLPTDPLPFTLPGASLKRSKQPPITLENYPLPDGTWRWVSRCWMIDMRTDSGEVQHDGFEYNWIFRRHNWRAQVGSFNAGGWVRRRRWIRLMVRPGKPKADNSDKGDLSLAPSNARGSELDKRRHRLSLASSFPPSVNTHHTGMTSTLWPLIDPDEVWMGVCEDDWQRCRRLMKQFGRDGRKLELWKLWLGFYHPDHKHKFVDHDSNGKRREKQWTEDEGPLPSELAAADILSKEWISIAPRQPVIEVLRAHGQEMLHLFIFPESRVQFLTLLAQASLLQEVNMGLGLGVGASDINFWSYASDLGGIVQSRVSDQRSAASTKDGTSSDFSGH